MNKQEIDLQAEREGRAIKQMRQNETNPHTHNNRSNKTALSYDEMWDFLLNKTIKEEQQ